MKRIVYLLVCSLLFFTSCKEEEVNSSVKPPTVVKTPLYIGKYLYTKDAEKVIAKIPFQKPAHISVLTGCECSDEVGEHATTKSSSQDDNQKEMIVAGDMLEYIKSLDKSLLEHLYVYYMYTNECDNCESGGSGDLVIVGLFLNIQDDVPLEKVTRYTVGKSTSIVSVGNNTPNKQVTPNRVVIPPVVKKQQPVKQQPKTVAKKQQPVKQTTKVAVKQQPIKKDQKNVAKGKSTAKNVKKSSPPKKKEVTKKSQNKANTKIATKKQNSPKKAAKATNKANAKVAKGAVTSEENDASEILGFFGFLIVIIVVVLLLGFLLTFVFSD